MRLSTKVTDVHNNMDIERARQYEQILRSGDGSMDPATRAGVDLDNKGMGKVYAATVISCTDGAGGGRLNVICEDAFGKGEATVKCATPYGGAGYGFFGVPGPGAIVLISNVIGDLPVGWVWFACVYHPEYDMGSTDGLVNQVAHPHDNSPEARKTYETDWMLESGEGGGDRPTNLTYGVPEWYLNYRGTLTPERTVWKSPKGNKIVMSERETENIEEKFIAIQTPLGKRIILDDAYPTTTAGVEPRTPGQAGDRIIISDGMEWDEPGHGQSGPNRIWIQSTAGEEGAEDSIQMFARNSAFLETQEGNINLSVLGTGTPAATPGNINLLNQSRGTGGDINMEAFWGGLHAEVGGNICYRAWNETTGGTTNQLPSGQIMMWGASRFHAAAGNFDASAQMPQLQLVAPDESGGGQYQAALIGPDAYLKFNEDTKNTILANNKGGDTVIFSKGNLDITSHETITIRAKKVDFYKYDDTGTGTGVNLINPFGTPTCNTSRMDGASNPIGADSICWVAREVFGEKNFKWLECREYIMYLAPSYLRTSYLFNGAEFAGTVKKSKGLRILLRPFFEYFAWRGRRSLLRSVLEKYINNG